MSGRHDVVQAEPAARDVAQWRAALAEQGRRACAGVMEIVAFGRMAVQAQLETGLPLTEVLEGCGVAYRTALRFVRMAEAADALAVAGGAFEGGALLSVAKESDVEKAKELKAEIKKTPDNDVLNEIWRKVVAGETPVRRWRAAYEGLLKTHGHFKDQRLATNYVNVADRALATLRNVWAHWEEMPGADKGKVAEAIAATLFGDPEGRWGEAPAAVLADVLAAARLRDAAAKRRAAR